MNVITHFWILLHINQYANVIILTYLGSDVGSISIIYPSYLLLSHIPIVFNKLLKFHQTLLAQYTIFRI